MLAYESVAFEAQLTALRMYAVKFRADILPARRDVNGIIDADYADWKARGKIYKIGHLLQAFYVDDVGEFNAFDVDAIHNIRYVKKLVKMILIWN